MKIGERIKLKRQELNMSQEELANKLGYKSRSSINKIEKDGRELPQSKIKAIADALNTTPSYIMGWEEETFDIYSIPNIIPIPKTKKIPLIGEIACGTPILAEQNISDYLSVSSNIKCDFALKCKGESMINARIFDGDIVLIKQQPDVENGEIAAVMIDNEATLKRVYKYENSVELRAENPMVAPMNFTSDDYKQIRILGKAVYFISKVI